MPRVPNQKEVRNELALTRGNPQGSNFFVLRRRAIKPPVRGHVKNQNFKLRIASIEYGGRKPPGAWAHLKAPVKAPSIIRGFFILTNI